MFLASVAAAALAVLTCLLGAHQVEEGHVGLYYRGGALTPRVTEAGWHLMIPFFDRNVQVQTTVQSDSVRNVPCGTSGGVMVRLLLARLRVYLFPAVCALSPHPPHTHLSADPLCKN